MPVDTKHPDVEEWEEDWTRCRVAFRGRKAVKAARTDYLPRLEEQEAVEYEDYLLRAGWFPATERTVRGFTGAVLRKGTEIEIPDSLRHHLDDVTLTGVDVQGFQQRILKDQILMSRVGVEVAMPPNETSEQRPYWNLWTAENIINWRTLRINGQQQLVMVVLKEMAPTFGEDEFDHGEEERIRVLKLEPVTIDEWRYKQEIWIKVKKDKREEWVLFSEVWPSRRGVLLDHIPFTFFGASSIEPRVEKPASLDLVDLNFGWYLNSADYENALSAIKPVYYAFGIESGSKLVVGSRRVLTSPETGASAGILQGSDPEGLRKAMDEKKQDMAMVAGRMLEQQPTKAETAFAVKVRGGGDQASLRTIASTHGLGLERVIRDHVEWAGGDPEGVEVDPNMDFIDATLPPDQIRAYMELHQNGLISYETFYTLLQGGELTRPGVDWETEKSQIEVAEEQLLAARGDFGNEE